MGARGHKEGKGDEVKGKNVFKKISSCSHSKSIQR
jgi:hypothetical protein